MKLTRNLKKHLLPVCLVLAFALLLGLTLNLYKPLKQLTQKKVPNPDNLLNAENVTYAPYSTKEGISYDRAKDGSWHIYGTSQAANSGVCLTLRSFELEAGKTYSFSSGLKHASLKGYYMCLLGSDGKTYLGDVKPEGVSVGSNQVFGAFEAKSGVSYFLNFVYVYSGAVIDDVAYPVLVEGTEPGDFYTYK